MPTLVVAITVTVSVALVDTRRVLCGGIINKPARERRYLATHPEGNNTLQG